MKSKMRLANVSQQDIEHNLPDLHYTAILTVSPIDAVLLCLGLVDEYQAARQLPPRRNGQKLYIRAAASLSEKQYFEFFAEDKELFAELIKHRRRLQTIVCAEKNAKVTFKSFGSGVGKLWFPLDCIVGSIVPRAYTKDLREWTITQPVLLDTFYLVPSRGGFYFLRELLNPKRENHNGNK